MSLILVGTMVGGYYFLNAKKSSTANQINPSQSPKNNQSASLSKIALLRMSLFLKMANMFS